MVPLEVVAPAVIPSTWEAKAEILSWVQGQPGLGQGPSSENKTGQLAAYYSPFRPPWISVATNHLLLKPLPSLHLSYMVQGMVSL